MFFDYFLLKLLRWKQSNFVSHNPVTEKRHSQKRYIFDQVLSDFRKERVVLKYANHICHSDTETK